MSDINRTTSNWRSWVIIGLLFMLILAKGVYAFMLIGDRGQPGWDYGTVADVPSQSPYAIYKLLPYPQHIKGRQGK